MIEITSEYLASQGLSSTFPKRFWKKVNKTDGCWLWTGAKRGGYGRISPKRKGMGIDAHRASWILHNGPIPNGKLVLHKCPTGTNPACVNPEHLYIGTPADNASDREREGHGNHPKGSEHGCAKLNEKRVREILDLFDEGLHTKSEIAIMYGVTRTMIYCIVARKNWRHVQRNGGI